MRPRRTTPLRRLASAVLALSALAAGCGEPASTGDGRRAVPQPADELEAPVTPARYRTRVVFVPHGDGPAAYLRLGQTARPGTLVRRYRGWVLESGRVRRVLAVDDTVRVPRAAWRPLPASGLRVSVDRNGRLQALVLDGPDEPLRLLLDPALAEWTGPTGQPERLAAARAVRDGDTVAGLLLERRGARPLDTPGPRTRSGILLVAGPGPIGAASLLTLPDGGAAGTEPDSAGPLDATVAHVLVGGRTRSWSPVRVRRTDGEPAAWELEPGGGGALLRLRPAADPSVVPAPVEGSLRTGERELPVAGLIVADPEP